MAATACSLPAARPHASHILSRGPLLTALVICDALHRLQMVDESAVYASAIGFVGAAAAVPAVPAAQRGAAAQAHGAYRQHACRMRSHALMSMCAAAAGMSHAAHLAARPLDIGRRTPLASIRDRHMSARSALCTLGLVRTSPSRRAHRGPQSTGSNVVVTGGNGSIYVYMHA